jgi:hypothetical protein
MLGCRVKLIVLAVALSFSASNPVCAAWAGRAPMNTARANHTATLLQNGNVLVAGGLSAAFTTSAEIYDPVANTWTPVAPMNAARGDHSATLLVNGKVLVAGGYNGLNALSSAEIYNPSNNSWTTTPPMNSARFKHTATLLPNGKVLIAGGSELTKAELYDPSTNMWIPVPDMSAGRQEHTATLLNNGKVLITGGLSPNGPIAEAQLFDFTTNTWSPGGSMTINRYRFKAALLNNGKVLAASGTVTSCEIYDPATNIWSFGPSVSTARDLFAMTILGNGNVLATGGEMGSTELNTTEVYSALSNSWSSDGNMTTPRQSHTITLFANGKALVTGGLANNTILASAEEYTSGTLVHQTITFGPIAEMTFGDNPFFVSASTTSNLPVTFSIVSGPATINGGPITLTGAGLVTVRASQSGDATFAPAQDIDRSFVVNKATPVITWVKPAAIAAGTPLGSAQLNATANVLGSFSYYPTPGAMLGAGMNQELFVLFTPGASNNYEIVTAKVFIDISAVPSTANSSPSIVSGVVYSPLQITAGSPVQFSVSALDPDGDGISYAWNFGDSTTGAGSSASHTYAAQGTYTAALTASDGKGGSTVASVTFSVGDAGAGAVGPLDSDGDGFSDAVEIAAGTSPLNATEIPALTSPDSDLLPLPNINLGIKLNFASPGHDSIRLAATLLLSEGFNLSTKQIVVETGGVARSFTLNVNGISRSAGASVIVHGKGTASRTVRLQMNLSNGDFAAALARFGLNNATINKGVDVPVTVIFDGKVYKQIQAQTYKAKDGKGGIAHDKK